MLKGLGATIWRPLCAGVVACVVLAVLAASSSALQVTCAPNADGSQTCRGTDSFSYAGQYNAGCPSAVYAFETVTIDEEVPQDATSVTGTWGIDPTTICGGITDAGGVAYKQGDTLRGGGPAINDQGKRVWRWTVKVKGKDPGGDHPQVVVNVTYDRPPASTGGGGNPGGNPGGGSTGSTGSGLCDWSVAFDNPPKTATSTPVGYHLTVHNGGTGPCPPTTLKLTHGRGVDTEFALLVAGAPGPFADPELLFVPGLAPGGSVTFHVLARPKVAALGTKSNRIRLRASLPADHDSPNGGDEFATVKTTLKPKPIDVTGGQTDGHGHGTLTVDCPAGEHKHDHCAFKLEIPDTVLPQNRLLFLPLGTAQGTVLAGHEGDLHLRLREAGQRLLEHRHEITRTVVGTRTEDGAIYFVVAEVTLTR
jgi:hypothetical protein